VNTPCSSLLVKVLFDLELFTKVIDQYFVQNRCILKIIHQPRGKNTSASSALLSLFLPHCQMATRL